MSGKKQPTSWRCKSVQQQKDKMLIYNSREWHDTRTAQLRCHPLCELCLKEGRVVSATCVHHIHPIEDSGSMAEMRMWAFKEDNLQSLCNYHHAEVHRQAASHTREAVRERAKARQERWIDRLEQRFTGHSASSPDEQPEP